MQDALLSYIFNRIQDEDSYFEVGFDANDEVVSLRMFDGSTAVHKKIPVTGATLGAETYFYKYGPTEDWSP